MTQHRLQNHPNMSINPFCSSSSSSHNLDHPSSKDTCFFSVVQQVNNNDGAADNQCALLFEKPLTPSDVGKLNRLVIPKQYAEKYFPLRSACGTNNPSGESLLIFEDELGKVWKFRYSYWTSSQSYVLTKGWSRYVKEKGLTAGDVVSFQQYSSGDTADKLFITWRRRAHNNGTVLLRRKYDNSGDYWSSRTTFFPAHYPYHPGRPMMNLLHKYSGGENKMAISKNSRRLRLFGVNMELVDQSEPSDDIACCEDSALLNHGLANQLHQFYPDDLHVFN